MSKSLKLQIVENARTLIQENNIGVGVWPKQDAPRMKLLSFDVTRISESRRESII
jgi:hypothetical protein